MAITDYEGQVHREYARGRALAPDVGAHWVRAFAERLPPQRPLHGLDLGSGTGRFSPALADAFGPVLAVEPSNAMRQVAERDAVHPQVQYASGTAEDIPASEASLDYCLLYLVWHHVADPARAAREIMRVLRPGGTLLCRSQFSDRMPDLWWLHHFPHGPETDAAMYRSLDEDLSTLIDAGLEPAPGLVWVDEPSLGTKAQRLEQLRTRTLSVLHRMPDEDVSVGFASLEAEVRADPDAPAPGQPVTLLIMRKPG